MNNETERELFVRHIQATEQREPLLWSQVWANSMQEGPMPDHMIGKYLIGADQKAWLAWQARAALSPASLEAVQRDAWISVDERMPNDSETCDGRVAVFSASGYSNVAMLVKGKLLSIEDDITHWMPLPPAPIAAAPQKGEA